MEVHHHSHTKRNKWTHYFWEFMMLFLAVFCGFLAEYQLEHKIEKDRELQFIKLMISDLEDDKKSLDSIIAQEYRGIRLLDTLIHLLNDPMLAKQQGDKLYYAGRIGPRSTPFSNNNRTFDQLRNSGGFRLIRKGEASNKIMGYYNQFSLIRLLEGNYNSEFNNYKQVAARALDPEILRRQESTDGNIQLSTDNPALLTYDEKLLKEMAFHVVQMNGSRRGKLRMFESLVRNVDELVDDLKKTYRLK